MVFLNEWNLGALWIWLVDIKTSSFYLCKNETTPPKLLLWELCVFYVNITLITANINRQQLPHTKLQLKGTMPGPLRTSFTWLLHDINKNILEFLGKSWGNGNLECLISQLKLVRGILDMKAGGPSSGHCFSVHIYMLTYWWRINNKASWSVSHELLVQQPSILGRAEYFGRCIKAGGYFSLSCLDNNTTVTEFKCICIPTPNFAGSHTIQQTFIKTPSWYHVLPKHIN